MSVTVRLTIDPGEEIVVDDREYLNLLRLGLIVGESEPAPADPNDVEVAALLNDETSLSFAALGGQVVTTLTESPEVGDALVAAVEATGHFAAAETVDAVAGIALRGTPVRKRPVEKQVAFFGATGHGWVTGSGASFNDTTVPMLGTQSLTLTVPANGASSAEKSGMTAFTIVGRSARVVLRKTAGITGVILYFASDSGLVNRVGKNLLQSSGEPSDIDLVIEMPIGDFGPSGTPDLANITMVRVLAQAGPAGGTVSIGAISTIKDATANLPNGAAVLSFDDTNIDHWTYARPKLAQYGYGATLYPNCAALLAPTSSNYTLAQAAYMQDVHGFDFGAHCIDLAHHIDHVGQTEAWLRAHFEAIVAFNKAHGFRGNSFAWPNTSSDTFARKIAADYFRSARGPSVDTREVHPPSEPMATRAVNAGSYTEAELKVMVDKAKAGHSVVHFFFHALPVTKVAANDVARQVFYNLVDYIAAQAVPVYTMAQLMDLPVA